jgi:hypothetical protein
METIQRQSKVGCLETGLKYRNSAKELVNALLKSQSNWGFLGW